MTSPAQLKYLDAMGIPVWVSRDLISKESLVIESSEELVFDAQSEVNNSDASKTQLSGNSAAQNILESLDEKSSTSNIKETNPAAIENVIADTVSQTKIPVDTKPNFDNSHLESVSSENLLYKSFQHYLFASGDENAEWLVIGHSPEPYKAFGVEPFASEAGVLLNNMLKAVGIKSPRRQSYMVNVYDINNDRQQTKDDPELIKLNLQLRSIIERVKPRIVLIVGQIAAQNLLQIDDPLIVMRSKIYQLTDKQYPCVVTYYPNYLLQKPIDKRKAWNDLKLAMSAIENVS